MPRIDRVALDSWFVAHIVDLTYGNGYARCDSLPHTQSNKRYMCWSFEAVRFGVPTCLRCVVA